MPNDPGPSFAMRVLSIGDVSPTYGLLDGVWILSVFYPLWFGVLVGDTGHGLVLLILALVLRTLWRSPAAAAATSLLLRAAVLAMAFGLLYGEFFGNTGTLLVRTLTSDSGADIPAFAPRTLPLLLGVAVLAVVIVLMQLIAIVIVGAVRARRSGSHGSWGPLLAYGAVLASGLLAWLVLTVGSVANALGELSAITGNPVAAIAILTAASVVIMPAGLLAAALAARSLLERVHHSVDDGERPRPGDAVTRG